MAEFAGFTKDTTKFLRGLGKNNSKDWFVAHRADYEEHYLEPAQQLVGALGEKVAKIAPAVHAEPRVNGSIFRINRDVRFSKDKTPYKDHIDIWLWEGADRKTAISGFFLRIRAQSIELGAGCHGFDRDALAAYRSKVADERAGDALAKTVSKLERAGFPVKGEHYKKLPTGVAPISELRDRLMRYNALWCSVSEPLPKEFYSSAFASYCAGIWRKLAPLHQWIVAEVK